jgi:ribosomal protein L11 methyltransferase
VPSGRAEQARALMLALFPQGFEERETDDGGLELIAYTDAGGEERLWHVFGRARSEEVGEGWEERWRAFHRGLRIGPLWVGPPWEEAPAGALPVVIEPGRAFGTGSHATTRLCLELLLELPLGSLLDVGCGSGVIAVAAAKLGFRPVWAIDQDVEGVLATRRNAAVNGVAVEVVQADALRRPLPRAEAAVVNITRAAVEALAPRVGCALLVTSGYLASEELRLPGFLRLARREQEGWAADLWRRAPGQ